MQTILVVFHLFLAIGLVGLILIQHGKGADAGAAFGSGASATVFGARGSASFLTRATAILATLFFITSMVLAYFASQGTDEKGLMEAVQPQAVETIETPAASDVPVVPGAETSVSDVPTVGGDLPEAINAESAGDVPSVPSEVPTTPETESVTEIPEVKIED
jgi:preprotein translocase subunit SecG